MDREKNEPKEVGGKMGSSRKLSILEAAIKVFAQKGFHGATTLEIAKEAGVSEGTVFKYFKTKKELLLSVAAPAIVSLVFRGLMDEKGQDEEEILRNFIFNQFQAMKSNKELVKLLFYESLFEPELRDKFLDTVIHKAGRVIKEYYTEQVEIGKFREINPEVAVYSLMGMLGFYLVWQELLGGGDFSTVSENEMLEGIVQIFLNGVTKK